ncbi:putative methylxanthine N7-demethylase NdmC [Pandoraea captiosa]|uniref:Putative methylxanthine N7-demethylase NdmC n=1 Tax=Pandoraea captiosa TaxID=2508302 RepID=A0A5E4ZXF3_9BURK|nr:aromatic ring-hydroxylating dioxygenase subunit alpha [Pandoraea captiosa]VVE64630.1 putative methylxanthine N7-demethylase NdmC [Pandoraea captiosa]
MEADRLLFEDWHPVAALEDVVLGREFSTRLLGRAISFARTQDGVSGTWSEEGLSKPLSIKEDYGTLWASFSDSPRALFPMPEFAESDRRVVSAGSTRVNVSGLRAVENFLDMAHFPFVHTDILGAEPLTEVLPYNVKIDEELDEVIATDCRFAQPRASATALEPIETQYVYRVTRPNVAILYKTCPPDPTRWDVLCLFVQPVSEEWCIAHTIMCYVDEMNSDEQLRRFQQTIFGQDLMILLNQVPKRLPIAPSHENPVRADVLATAYRRWLREGGLSYGAIRD